VSSSRDGRICNHHGVAAVPNGVTTDSRGGLGGRPLVLFALMSVLWGIPYLFIRIAVDEVSPTFLVLARTAIAAVILLPIALARIDLRPVLARWPWVVAFAAIEIAIPWVALGSAEQHVSSSLAALVIAGVPLVGTVIAFATGSADRMGPVGLLGLLLGIVGVTAIVGSGMGSTDPVALAQLGLVAVCYAVGPVILVRKLGDLPSVGVMALSLAITAVVFTPIGIVSWPAAMPSPAAITSILVLAVFCTAVAFLVFAALVAAVGAVRSTVITYINPAVAAVLGVAVLGETLTPPMLLGFVLVTLGSVLATRRPPGAAAPVPVESADPA
jgi:drug/metabolite transporter (DMT)-like permease